MTSTDNSDQERADAEALVALFVDDDREPCGENMCHCDCGQGHVCACDCWRCGECGQHADHCQCDDEDSSDDLCDGCGRDLNETDGNTFDMGDGSTIQLCPDCGARQDEEV